MLSFTHRLHRRMILLAIFASLISMGSVVWAQKIRLTANEFEAVRHFAQQWVEYERLPSSNVHQIPNEETEFKKAWTEAGDAAAKVATAWGQAFETDPLLQRALECLDRYHDLQWQYDMLRSGLRQRHGLDGFRKLERQSQDWIATNGHPWLDLQDTELVRLVLWWAEFAHSNRDASTNQGPTVPYLWLTKPGDRLSQWTENFISLRSADLNSEEDLTEKRAIELFRIGVKRKRKELRKQHANLTANLDLPLALFRYWKIRQEAEAMHTFSYGYLQIELPKYEDIAKAEKEFEVAMKKVGTLRPYALVALRSVHMEAAFEGVQDLQRQQAKLQAIFSDKGSDREPVLR